MSAAGFGLRVLGSPVTEPFAVHQHQGALRAEAAQVHGRNTARGTQRVGVVAEVRTRVDEVLRQLVHEVRDVGMTLLLNFIARYHGEGARRADIRGHGDTRARDDHFLELWRVIGGCGGWGSLREDWRCGCDSHCECPAQATRSTRVVAVSHRSS